ncbi:2,3-diaminopropionate biosynthesis protein SbnA [Kitasatospora sp. NPDC054939]
MSAGPAKGILDTIGRTPLVELDGLMRGSGFRVFAKVERFNPGGSIKDRSGLNMLLGKIRSGELIPGLSVVVESSSGNLAIGMAQICRYFGLQFISVVDAKTTGQNLAILRAYGATIEMVSTPEPDGEYLPGRIRRVRELLAANPYAYSPNQYANPLNPAAHEETMREVVNALDGEVDYIFSPASTCGTMTGAGAYIRKHGLRTKLVAVDAVGSVLFGDAPTKRLIPGHGASIVPPLLDPSLPDEVVHVSDLECVVGCRRLVATEAILAGGSSGAAVSAIAKLRDRIEPGANCVLVFPDGGDRYLDTIYSDEWVTTHFGAVAHLWESSETAGAVRC